MSQIGRPAGSGKGSTIKLANGRFRAQRTVSDEWGTTKRLEAVAATKTKAQNALDAKVQAWRSSHVKPARRRTFGSWAEEWMSALETRGTRTKTKKPLALSTVRAYRSTMSNHVLPHLEKAALSAIDVPMIERMLAAVAQSTSKSKPGTPLGPDTARKALAVLQSCLADAEHLRLVPENVAKQVRPPETPRRAETWATPDRMRDVLDQLLAAEPPPHAFSAPVGEGRGRRGSRVRPWWQYRSVLAALILTGARPGELLGLRRKLVEVDEDGEMYLGLSWQLEEPDWACGCGEACVAAANCPKREMELLASSKYDRIIGTRADDNLGLEISTARVLSRPKSDAGNRDFHAYPELRHAIELALAEPARWGLVWENRGQPMTEATLRRAWKDLAVAFDLGAGSKPYDARHSFIDHLHLSGVPIEIAMAMVGQTSQQVHRGYRTAQKRAATRAGTALLSKGARR
ncbi:hypothetical protein L332_10335 [Agrococcus pavilionensis RW1]|uniref:Tyr recombinase domain-containing protein n=1 Tax=Agrococcus pavilionensis RW1 TaxID=1330458 RepID=U1LQU5_9MICO|nr:hypothetical protein L332_10335 [Agrococcus pavilionensis RW1]